MHVDFLPTNIKITRTTVYGKKNEIILFYLQVPFYLFKFENPVKK